MSKPLGVTELVLRDGHQSLFATRMRIEDMLPIAEKLDKVGYHSIETWGGATFDACIRYLGEDPWERLRRLKKAMPKTPHQMLFRAQNILGYRHYADDVVRAFVERAAENGMDIFRIFDAMNDMRNLQTAIKATIDVGKHAQGTMSYTVSPVHTVDMWLDMAKRLEDMGAHSVCIKDMAGLLKPYVAEELVSRLKESLSIPIALHAHATTGLSTTTIAKAVEAGVDSVDTSISSMSMTYGHSATESVVAIFDGEPRATGLDLTLLEEIAAYFREVRKKYAKFEGSLKGVDSRILVSQVPGGMLTNMENQLKEQGAGEKLDLVLQEIPRVRQDLGYIPLVTPTSQIVGTQAVLNVLTGERYKSISKETAGVLKGEYGATAAPVNKGLQDRVLQGKKAITCRPADLIEPEMDKLTAQLKQLSEEKGIKLAENEIEDVLIYALFPQIGIKFLQHRDDPSVFEPPPEKVKQSTAQEKQIARQEQQASITESYDVKVNGRVFSVAVSPAGSIESIEASKSHNPKNNSPTTPLKASHEPGNSGQTIDAPLAGNIFKLNVKVGDTVSQGQVVIILEAMKMETEVRAQHAGKVGELLVNEGDAVKLADPLLRLV